MRAQSLTMGPVEWLLLILLSLLWGTTYFWVSLALRELQPFSIVLVRVALAALVLLAITASVGERLPGLRQWRPYFIMATLNNVVPFSLIMWGQTEIAGSAAAILNATTPLFAVVFAHFLTQDEKFAAHKLIGVLIGIGGVAILMGPGAITGLSAGLLAQLAILTASIFYALSGIYGKRFKATPPLVTATCQMSAAALLMLPVVLIFDRSWTLSSPSGSTIAALLCLGVLGTAVAFLLFFRILATAGAINLMLVTMLMPPTAILMGVMFLGEDLSVRHYLGLMVIALALLTVDGRSLRWMRRRFRSPGLEAG